MCHDSFPRFRVALAAMMSILLTVVAAAEDLWAPVDALDAYVAIETGADENPVDWVVARGGRAEPPDVKGDFIYYRHEDLGIWFGPFERSGQASAALLRLRATTRQLATLDPRYETARAVRFRAPEDDTIRKLYEANPDAMELRWILEQYEQLEQIVGLREELEDARARVDAATAEGRQAGAVLLARAEILENKVDGLMLEMSGASEESIRELLMPGRSVVRGEGLRIELGHAMAADAFPELDIDGLLSEGMLPTQALLLADTLQEGLERSGVVRSDAEAAVAELRDAATQQVRYPPSAVEMALATAGSRLLRALSAEAGFLPAEVSGRLVPEDALRRAAGIADRRGQSALAGVIRTAADGALPPLDAEAAEAARQEAVRAAAGMVTATEVVGGLLEQMAEGGRFDPAAQVPAFPPASPSEVTTGVQEFQRLTAGMDLGDFDLTRATSEGLDAAGAGRMLEALQETVGPSAAWDLARSVMATTPLGTPRAMNASQVRQLMAAMGRVGTATTASAAVASTTSGGRVDMPTAVEEGLAPGAATDFARGLSQGFEQAARRAIGLPAADGARAAGSATAGPRAAAPRSAVEAARRWAGSVGLDASALDGRRPISESDLEGFVRDSADALTQRAIREGLEADAAERARRASVAGAADSTRRGPPGGRDSAGGGGTPGGDIDDRAAELRRAAEELSRRVAEDRAADSWWKSRSGGATGDQGAAGRDAAGGDGVEPALSGRAVRESLAAAGRDGLAQAGGRADGASETTTGSDRGSDRTSGGARRTGETETGGQSSRAVQGGASGSEGGTGTTRGGNATSSADGRGTATSGQGGADGVRSDQPGQGIGTQGTPGGSGGAREGDSASGATTGERVSANNRARVSTSRSGWGTNSHGSPNSAGGAGQPGGNAGGDPGGNASGGSPEGRSGQRETSGGTASGDESGRSRSGRGGAGSLPLPGSPIFEFITRVVSSVVQVMTGIPLNVDLIGQVLYTAFPEVMEDIAESLAELEEAIAGDDVAKVFAELSKVAKLIAPFLGDISSIVDTIASEGFEAFVTEFATSSLEKLAREGLKRVAEEYGLPPELVSFATGLPDLDFDQIEKELFEHAKDFASEQLQERFGIPMDLADSLVSGDLEGMRDAAGNYAVDRLRNEAEKLGLPGDLVEKLARGDVKGGFGELYAEVGQLDRLVDLGVLDQTVADRIRDGDFENAADAFERQLQDIPSRVTDRAREEFVNQIADRGVPRSVAQAIAEGRVADAAGDLDRRARGRVDQAIRDVGLDPDFIDRLAEGEPLAAYGTLVASTPQLEYLEARGVIDQDSLNLMRQGRIDDAVERMSERAREKVGQLDDIGRRRLDALLAQQGIDPGIMDRLAEGDPAAAVGTLVADASAGQLDPLRRNGILNDAVADRLRRGEWRAGVGVMTQNGRAFADQRLKDARDQVASELERAGVPGSLARAALDADPAAFAEGSGSVIRQQAGALLERAGLDPSLADRVSEGQLGRILAGTIRGNPAVDALLARSPSEVLRRTIRDGDLGPLISDAVPPAFRDGIVSGLITDETLPLVAPGTDSEQIFSGRWLEREGFHASRVFGRAEPVARAIIDGRWEDVRIDDLGEAIQAWGSTVGWDDVAAATGVDVDTIRRFAQSPRPDLKAFAEMARAPAQMPVRSAEELMDRLTGAQRRLDLMRVLNQSESAAFLGERE